MLLIALIATCLTQASARADLADFRDAQALYAGGKYEEALKALEAAPQETSAYHHNVGTVYFRLGSYGMALAHLEKAQALDPGDPAIAQNLQLARAQLALSLGAEKIDRASTWLETLAGRFPLEEIRGMLGLLAFVTTLFWLRGYWKTRRLRGTLFHPAGIVAVFAFALTSALYGAQRLATERPAAVVLVPQTVRSGPGDAFMDLGRLESGVKVRALGPTSGDWRQVRFGPDAIGWIKASSVLLL
jgi:tetratricopeptide (TPR) repeat protein